MGMRFNLSSANWLAYLLEPKARIPKLGEDWEEKETLRIFLRKLSNRFYSSRQTEFYLKQIANRAERLLDHLEERRQDGFPSDFLLEVRTFLGDRPWIALIIPSGHDNELDRMLCDEEFLKYLVSVRPEDPGLILQLEEPPEGAFSLLDVFPGFNTALNESTNWPGVLVWRPEGDSVFLPLGSRSRHNIEEHAHWIFSHLATSLAFDLGLLKTQYVREFPGVVEDRNSLINFLQLSDLHLGSNEANQRLPRVQQLVRNVVEELGSSSRIVPVISGDLMDSPHDKHLNTVRGFIDFLQGLSTEEPVIVLGNHDVRKNGYLNDDYRPAIQLSQSKTVWYDQERIGLLCVNSVAKGKLARGFVGESQLMDIGSEIDRKNNNADYTLVAMLHHHPVAVDYPEWYSRPFYERILGTGFEKTDKLEDAGQFINFTKQRHVAVIIHGHKHIPQVTQTEEGVPVYGCGSTVGKVATTDGGTFMSLNIISVNSQTNAISGRLLAERIPGGGLVEQRRHEIIMRSHSPR